MSAAEARHIAASAILQAGRPFVVLLRTYSETMPWRRNLQNEIFDQLSRSDVGVVSVRGQSSLADEEESNLDAELRARCPALWVEATDWKATVNDLIKRASSIICEVWSDTTGISDELAMCLDEDRTDETVVLLPQPGRKDMRNYDTFDRFWRLAIYEDFERYSLFSHPSTRSLRWEACKIHSLDRPPVRAANLDRFHVRAGIPVVIPELVALATEYLETKADWGSAALHAQNAWNIAVRLAGLNAAFTFGERDALVRAGVILANRLVQFNRIADAVAKLDVALTFTSEPALQHYSARLLQLRSQISEQYPGSEYINHARK